MCRRVGTWGDACRAAGEGEERRGEGRGGGGQGAKSLRRNRREGKFWWCVSCVGKFDVGKELFADYITSALHSRCSLRQITRHATLPFFPPSPMHSAPRCRTAVPGNGTSRVVRPIVVKQLSLPVCPRLEVTAVRGSESVSTMLTAVTACV
ncbi:hypothetical protein E2C01_069351 [Portunus trituberculatus]|uniref:Uncharacterized protein n=1 Tax=Portunus trituberculatus TaxID=210409 RepID=A0A5B7I1Y3_PORTR|nr:hypothetical protein [Portunus trituberculatus]